MKTQLLLLLAILLSSLMSAQDFTYIEVDNNRGKWGDIDEPVWLRYFGIDAADLNHDGLKDIASGRYIYLNPGDDMTGDWERLDVGFNVDIMLICNIDDDEYADVIAEALPDVYWLEADNHFGTAWKAMKIGNIPKTGHNNGQGYLMADIIKGGKKEILLAAHDGIYATEIPTNPVPENWKFVRIIETRSDEGFDAADIDGDGKQELVFWNQGGSSLCISEIPEKPRQKDEWDWEPIYVYSNDSEMDAVIGSENYPGWQAINEHEGLFAEDIDGDGIKDIIGGGRWFKYQDGKFIENIIDASYTFSRTVAGQFVEGGRPEVVLVVGDGKGPMYLYQWYGRNNSRANTGTWKKKLILPEVDNGHTIDVLDFNDDGHLDIFSAEMRFGEGNPDSEVRFLLGDGKGNFTNTVVIKGLGIHEGKLGDLDGDGDLDIVAKPYSWKSPRIDLLINENGK